MNSWKPRCALIAVFASSLVAVLLSAEAQQKTKVARIGYLVTNVTPNSHQREAFRQGLRDLGYVEGRNLVIEIRDAEGRLERLPALAAELVALKVDVILAAAGTLPAMAARQATKTLPIVFIAVGNPVTSGLAASLARPGGNATGSSALSRSSLASGWNCSSRPFRQSVALLSSGSQVPTEKPRERTS